jgi:hypothetical protein
VRAYRYPAWQIYEGQLLPGLGEVLAILAKKKLQPLSIISYFLTPSSELDEARPLDLLRKGRVEDVVADTRSRPLAPARALRVRGLSVSSSSSWPALPANHPR